ncbi:MAG TPA: hypothetical protein PKD00_05285 [Burkholderiales bacterium]|nr:hypothetical protein [Burkholderiales bacterium]
MEKDFLDTLIYKVSKILKAKKAPEICKREFLKIRLADKKSWEELELILKENNLPIR